MKITIPENISDITLEQFQRFIALDKVDGITERDVAIEKLKIFIGFTDKQIDGMSQSDFDKLSKQIDEALNKPSVFKERFEMNDVAFGFHPNLDRMTTAEYVDLMNYNSEPETLHKLMAILFRPIASKDMLGNYTIEKYNGSDEYAEIMKQTPLSIVNGALVFFLNLSRELQINILKYSSQEAHQKAHKHQIFGISGVGMPVS